jgi:hypothetical protein
LKPSDESRISLAEYSGDNFYNTSTSAALTVMQ